MDINSYRPLTQEIANVISRLFSKILTKWLDGAVHVCPRQRRFRQKASIEDNTITLRELISKSKKNEECLAVVLLDLAKTTKPNFFSSLPIQKKIEIKHGTLMKKTKSCTICQESREMLE